MSERERISPSAREFVQTARERPSLWHKCIECLSPMVGILKPKTHSAIRDLCECCKDQGYVA